MDLSKIFGIDNHGLGKLISYHKKDSDLCHKIMGTLFGFAIYCYTDIISDKIVKYVTIQHTKTDETSASLAESVAEYYGEESKDNNSVYLKCVEISKINVKELFRLHDLKDILGESMYDLFSKLPGWKQLKG